MRRSFDSGEFYHVFNRGVEKRKIFLERSDYIRFIHDLYEFNDINPALEFSRRVKNVGRRVSHISSRKDYKRREPLVSLEAFVLMPNHHHGLIKQLREGGISLFMRKLHTGYTKAFNLKYKRSGHLFQGPFQDVYVENDTQLAHLVCYIHANPLDLWKPDWKEKRLTTSETKEALKFLEKYRWSSHLDYLDVENFPSVIDKKFLSDFFSGNEGYKKFFIDWLKQYEDNLDYFHKFIKWDVECPT